MSEKLRHVEEGKEEKRLKLEKLSKRNNAERQEMDRAWGAWVLNPPIFNPFALKRVEAKEGQTIIIRLAKPMLRKDVQERLERAFSDLNGTPKEHL